MLTNKFNWTLVRFDDPALHPHTAWQAVDENDAFEGLYDDDGDRIHVGNCSWTAIRDDLIPPFLA